MLKCGLVKRSYTIYRTPGCNFKISSAKVYIHDLNYIQVYLNI